MENGDPPGAKKKKKKKSQEQPENRGCREVPVGYKQFTSKWLFHLRWDTFQRVNIFAWRGYKWTMGRAVDMDA